MDGLFLHAETLKLRVSQTPKFRSLIHYLNHLLQPIHPSSRISGGRSSDCWTIYQLSGRISTIDSFVYHEEEEAQVSSNSNSSQESFHSHINQPLLFGQSQPSVHLFHWFSGSQCSVFCGSLLLFIFPPHSTLYVSDKDHQFICPSPLN